MDLFSADPPPSVQRPLADRMRPETLEAYLGQDHLTGPGKVLSRFVPAGIPPSLIIWGPPGCGKTTLARLIARQSNCHFASFSAVLSGVKEVREIVAEAGIRLKSQGRRTILFVDEIHRFNRAQQDAFLPHVEDGTIILFGATTENPSFSVNAPLLSRCKVLTLKPLELESIVVILKRALSDKKNGLGELKIRANDTVLREIAEWSEGDARRALNILEGSVALAPEKEGWKEITTGEVTESAQGRVLAYDKQSEEHYNVISAFIKSMRGSDPDAAVYWLARMLEAGEDPLFIARRMMIFASEDIGMADPHALPLAVSAHQTFEAVGLPEGWIPLSHAAVYLAAAPKSNASYKAYKNALAAIRETGSLPVPLHLRNAPTRLMKELGYVQEYRYPHDEPDFAKDQTYLPEKLLGKKFYLPKKQVRD